LASLTRFDGRLGEAEASGSLWDKRAPAFTLWLMQTTHPCPVERNWVDLLNGKTPLRSRALPSSFSHPADCSLPTSLFRSRSLTRSSPSPSHVQAPPASYPGLPRCITVRSAAHCITTSATRDSATRALQQTARRPTLPRRIVSAMPRRWTPHRNL
jgi:hypothetical protein